MPAVSHRGSSRRRTISEINMVPFIDVMLVLLIIFMVTAPLITTGMVDLPTVGRSSQRPDHVIEVVVGSDAALRVRVDGIDRGTATTDSIAQRVREAQQGVATTPVVISADKNVKYDAVVTVMGKLQQGGVQRVGLSVKNAGK
ncbi:MAG: ExbD/TolR family protein [Caldimonas sp.]|jgi:biopolymer transport protein TolR